MATVPIQRLTIGLIVTAVLVGTATLRYAHAQGHSMPGMAGPGEATQASEHAGMQMPGTPASQAGPATQPAGYSPVVIGPEVQQRIGVTTAKVTQGPLIMAVRTVGIVRPNETKVDQVHLRTEGWVQKLFVSFTGQRVRAGEPLLSIYSPQFFTAQQDYLIAIQSARGAATTQESPVVHASRRRLELWDVPQDEIEELVRTGQPKPILVLRSHVDGTVLEKKVFPGQYVGPQDTLFVLADLSTVWVQSKIYEYELPHTVVGQPTMVTLPAFPEKEFAGKIVFISPVVEEASRTVQVRVELPNADGLFRPGMFAYVTLTHDMGQGLLVPASAVIRTGERNIAFRVEAQDRFVPVEVKISAQRFGEQFQVLEGLKAGEQVVTSANFLIDSESRLKAGGAGMAGMPGMEMDGPAGQAPAGKRQDQMPGMDMSPSPEHSGRSSSQP